MELKPNMYVRSKYGIAKIIQTNFKDENEEDVLIVDKELEFGYVGCNDEHLCNINDILKSSYNIIDLIEVGDYVNKHKVIELWENNRTGEPSTLAYCEFGNGFIGFYNEEIKSIVTKEQFESMQYVIDKE